LEEKRLGCYDVMSTRAWFQALFSFQMKKTLLDDRTRTHFGVCKHDALLAASQDTRIATSVRHHLAKELSLDTMRN
jgi:hypothetical protein